MECIFQTNIFVLVLFNRNFEYQIDYANNHSVNRFSGKFQFRSVITELFALHKILNSILNVSRDTFLKFERPLAPLVFQANLYVTHEISRKLESSDNIQDITNLL